MTSDDPDDGVVGQPASVGSEVEQEFLAHVLPQPLYEQCLAASRFDSTVMADCGKVIRRTWSPAKQFTEAGLPDDKSVLIMSAEELRRHRDQTAALQAVRDLADALGRHEQEAFSQAATLLNRTHAARMAADAKQRSSLATSRGTASAAVEAARLAVETHEWHLAELPQPDEIPAGSEGEIARLEVEAARAMMELQRAALNAAEAAADAYAYAASVGADASDELTNLFDLGWRHILQDSQERRSARHRVAQRRRLWQRIRWMAELAVVLILGFVFDKLTGAVAGGAAVGLVSAAVFAVIEHFVLTPLLQRRANRADSDALVKELILSGMFWVLIRLQQADINNYADGSGAAPVTLLPGILQKDHL
jgi:hypothetical protein